MPDAPIAQTSLLQADRKPLLLSFICVLLAGLPFWLHTTSTERRALPFNAVSAWALQLVCLYLSPYEAHASL
jgi:hypothetical protein